MEHEVFVPVPADSLRQTLADPARVARCVPGLQQDADASAGPLAGRLKIRVGGHTITYRGALRITRQDGEYAVEGEGTEARGPGSVKLAVTLRLTPAVDGTILTFTGTAHAEGRLADVSADTAAQAVTRLLGRFASALGTATADSADAARAVDAAAEKSGHEGDDAQGGGDAVRPDAAADAAADAGDAAEGGTDSGAATGAAESGPHEARGAADDASGRTGARESEGAVSGSGADDEAEVSGVADDGTEPRNEADVFDVDVPPSALDPRADDAFGEDGVPPAEAAHARRTMIGRSAEEVDHAPPRGRYAPLPPPQPAASGGTLRWVAPAAALAIASAVVVGRALRRRR